MKRIVVALIALALVFSFIGCDAMIDVMNTMGSNVAGVEKKVVDDSLKAAKVTPSKAKVEDVDGTKTASFISGEGDDAKTLFAFSSGKKTNEIGEEEDVTTLTFGEGKNSFTLDVKGVALDPESVEAIITPSDISGVISGLKSGSKAEIEAELKKPADEESQKAVKGTQTILSAIVDEMGITDKITDAEMNDMTEEERQNAVKINAAIDSLNSVLRKDEEKKEVTQADVVVLTAVTNAFMNDSIFSSMSVLTQDEPVQKEGESDDDFFNRQNEFNDMKDKEGQKLMQTFVDESMALVDILSVVPSDYASGMSSFLSAVLSAQNTSNSGKEGN